ncbi:MAG TPA: FAD:protein FMN transferase [Phycisphaerales bacterium]|nr:FAD:protein FMN transferase [Phycisphaerales bacterium]
MGVSTQVTIEAGTREEAAAGAAAAFRRIGEIEDVASDYRPSSELMRLCAEAHVGEWRPVSPDLALLLTTAREVSARTGGAFDVTVGPAVRLWRQMRQTGVVMGADELAAARQFIDWSAVEVTAEPPAVRLLKAGVRLDLGGIAKGYAAREAGRVLEHRGLGHCLVAIAGDVYAGAAPSGTAGWRVEVAAGNATRVLLAEHACISTAGDTEQFVDVGGKLYGHIVDPRTGLGTTTGAVVTAIGRDGALVDACDTAAAVLGEHGARSAFAQEERVTLIVHRPDGFAIIGDPARVRWSE